MRLAGILDHLEPIALRDLADRVHVSSLTVQVDGQNGLGVRCDLGLDLAHVHQVGVGIDIDKHRSRTGQQDGLGRGDEGVRHGDHLVARSNAHGAQNDVQRAGAVADADAVLDAAELGELPLEGLHVLPQE